MAQLVTTIDDELTAAVDALVDAGTFDSRSAVVRSGLAMLVEQHRRAATGARITVGYLDAPETDAELASAVAATKAMITAEPW